MIRHTFLDKANTIVKGSKLNHGMNPVAELNYGKKISRALIHFDENKIREMYDNGCFPDTTKVKHILKLTNCMSQDGVPYEKFLNDGFMGEKRRAASFDVLLVLLNKDFDAGRGFDFASDTWIKNNRALSTQGSNWYYASSNNPWNIVSAVTAEVGDDTEVLSFTVDEDGIGSTEYFNREYVKYANNILHDAKEKTVVVGVQHFDFGNENFEFDITEVVDKFMTGELINHGFALLFTPAFEEYGQETVGTSVVLRPQFELNQCTGEMNITGMTSSVTLTTKEQTEEQYYVGFFTDNTNTFFHPYVETIYDDPIRDDRAQFYLGKTNRLYFYSIIDGEYTDLDVLPMCTIDDEENEFEVKKGGKGVYYVEIEPSEIDWEPNTIHYDTWSNLAVNGQEMPDMELEFVALPGGKYFQLGAGVPHKDILVPQVWGINDEEKIRQGEVRRVVVDCRKKYTTDKKEIVDSVEYRIFTKDATREIDVFPYHPVEKTFMENFFFVYTEDMVPGRYFVDFRIKANGETRYYREKLRFTVVDNITEFYD